MLRAYKGRSNETPGLKFGPTPTLGESQTVRRRRTIWTWRELIDGRCWWGNTSEDEEENEDEEGEEEEDLVLELNK